MIIAFLQHIKLCHEFDQSLLDNTNLSIYSEDQLPTTEKLLFFPSLIEEVYPPHINTAVYQIGWYLKRNTTHFFTIRFLRILLLELAYQYALPAPSIEQQSVPGLERRCSVWTIGIHWHNNDGVETLVEQVEDNQYVLLLMSCIPNAQQHMMRLHCELVQKILSLQQEYCPIIQCTEHLIDPSQLQYPLDQPSKATSYDMKQLVSCVRKDKVVVVSNNGQSKIVISQLLHIPAKEYLSLRTDLLPQQQSHQVSWHGPGASIILSYNFNTVNPT